MNKCPFLFLPVSLSTTLLNRSQQLDLALDRVKGVAQRINENKRRAETKSRLLETLATLQDLDDFTCGPILEAHRRLVVEGTLLEVTGYARHVT